MCVYYIHWLPKGQQEIKNRMFNIISNSGKERKDYFFIISKFIKTLGKSRVSFYQENLHFNELKDFFFSLARFYRSGKLRMYLDINNLALPCHFSFIIFFLFA